MLIFNKYTKKKTWIERRSESERRRGMDRRNLYRFESLGADRRVGNVRRTSEWQMK